MSHYFLDPIHTVDLIRYFFPGGRDIPEDGMPCFMCRLDMGAVADRGHLFEHDAFEMGLEILHTDLTDAFDLDRYRPLLAIISCCNEHRIG